MSESIVLKTYKGGSVTPQDDAIINQTVIGTNGIFKGCGISSEGGSLHVSQGFGMIRGRFFEVYESDFDIQLSSSETVLKGRLYVHIDLSNSDEPIQLLTEVSEQLSTLSGDIDINYNNTFFDMELAAFDVSDTGILNLAQTFSIITSASGGGGSSGTLERGRAYSAGDFALCENAPKWATLYCVQSGVTALSEPKEYANILSAGDTVTDGSCIFSARNVIGELDLLAESAEETEIRVQSLKREINSIGNDLGDMFIKVMSLADYNALDETSEKVIYLCYDDDTTKKISYIFSGEARVFVKGYEVTYHIDADRVTKKTFFAGENAVALAPQAVKNGYAFVGWRTDSKASEDVLEDYFAYEDTENILYAVFCDETEVTVSTNGENAVLKEGESNIEIASKLYYNNGSVRTGKIILPDCPYEKEGMVFCGWSTDADPAARLVPGKSENIGGLNLYAKWVTAEFSFPFVSSIIDFKIPENGIYELEVWGACGIKNLTVSNVNYEIKSGLGGYSKGYKRFEKNTVLYMNIGEYPGQNYWSSNGGGGVGVYSSSTNYGYNIGGAGGGATHIALKNGRLSQLSGSQDSVLIVAGGGGGGGIIDYTGDNPIINEGGSGGGLSGVSGSDGAMGGRQDKFNLTFGQGLPSSSSSSSYAIAGGGGGWYGGYYGSKGHSGGGGSGYIGGVPDFTYKGVLYAAETKAGVNDGNGYIHIRYIRCA